MKKKFFTVILSLFLLGSTMVSAQTTIDTAFITLHVYSKYNSLLAKIDSAVLSKHTDAYLDKYYTKKITNISVLENGKRNFTIKLPSLGNFSSSGLTDSSFSLTKENSECNSSISIFDIEYGKNGIPSIMTTGVGFGKMVLNSDDYQCSYYIKTEDLSQILTRKELSFFNMFMEKSFSRSVDTLEDGHTQWTLRSYPIGQQQVFIYCLEIEEAVKTVFDTLLKIGVVQPSFATIDRRGKVQYTLTDYTKTRMAGDPKLKKENIIRNGSLVVIKEGNETKTKLGWSLENSYHFGKKSIVIFSMPEAFYLDKSVFQTYCPKAIDWLGYVF